MNIQIERARIAPLAPNLTGVNTDGRRSTACRTELFCLWTCEDTALRRGNANVGIDSCIRILPCPPFPLSADIWSEGYKPPYSGFSFCQCGCCRILIEALDHKERSSLKGQRIAGIWAIIALWLIFKGRVSRAVRQNIRMDQKEAN